MPDIPCPAGEDRAFRMFSVIQDQQSRELSQGKTAKRARQLKIEQAELKLPPVTDMAACQVRFEHQDGERKVHMNSNHTKFSTPSGCSLTLN